MLAGRNHHGLKYHETILSVHHSMIVVGAGPKEKQLHQPGLWRCRLCLLPLLCRLSFWDELFFLARFSFLRLRSFAFSFSLCFLFRSCTPQPRQFGHDCCDVNQTHQV